MTKVVKNIAYFDFLHRCMEDDRKHGIRLDQTAVRVLEAIALAEHAGNPLTVTEAMQLSVIASPATLHRQIDKLVDGEWVERRHLEPNLRTKYLFPTVQARRYFDRRRKLMEAL